MSKRGKQLDKWCFETNRRKLVFVNLRKWLYSVEFNVGIRRNRKKFLRKRSWHFWGVFTWIWLSINVTFFSLDRTLVTGFGLWRLNPPPPPNLPLFEQFFEFTLLGGWGKVDRTFKNMIVLFQFSFYLFDFARDYFSMPFFLFCAFPIFTTIRSTVLHLVHAGFKVFMKRHFVQHFLDCIGKIS